MRESNNQPDIRESALKLYANSHLRKRDEVIFVASITALEAVLEELGVNKKVDGPEVEVEGLHLTAHFEPPRATGWYGMGKALTADEAEKCIQIRVHDTCKICGETRHSRAMRPKTIILPRSAPMIGGLPHYGLGAGMPEPQMEISIAVQIGQWLMEPHACEERSTRRMGFKRERDEPEELN